MNDPKTLSAEQGADSCAAPCSASVSDRLSKLEKMISDGSRPSHDQAESMLKLAVVAFARQQAMNALANVYGIPECPAAIEALKFAEKYFNDAMYEYKRHIMATFRPPNDQAEPLPPGAGVADTKNL